MTYKKKQCNDCCKELISLQVTSFEWTHSFKQKNKGKGATIIQMSILNRVEYKAKNINKSEYFQGVKSILMVFDSYVGKNMKDNFYIPINFNIYQSLNNKPYIQTVYLKIALYLSSGDYRTFEQTARTIMNVLNIESKRYSDEVTQGKTNRGAFLQEIKEYLEQKMFSNKLQA